jgi:hypothetical protein
MNIPAFGVKKSGIFSLLAIQKKKILKKTFSAGLKLNRWG